MNAAKQWSKVFQTSIFFPKNAPTYSHDTPAASVGRGRIEAIDIFKGLAILEVVIHHVFGMSLRYIDSESFLYNFMAILNRFFHFAVPAFLFMTAAVLSKNYQPQSFSPTKFYIKRIFKSLLPYLIWSVIYAIFKIFTTQQDINLLYDIKQWSFWLFSGKSYYHLYFLFVALQFYAIMPLLHLLWNKKPKLGKVFGVAVFSQVVVYLINNWFFRIEQPASYLFWYIIPIALGIHFGINYSSFLTFWHKYRLFIFGLLAWSIGTYVPMGYSEIIGIHVNPMDYNVSYFFYGAIWSIFLFGLSHSFCRFNNIFIEIIRLLGENSLQIYLLHPAILFGLAFWGFPRGEIEFFVFVIMYITLCILIPLSIARSLKNTWPSRIVFGR